MNASIVAVVLSLSLGACAQQQASVSAPQPAAEERTEASLVAALRAAGFSVVPAGQISQPFFSPKAHVYTVNGDDLQVYEYRDAAAAQSEAAAVSPDGSSVGKSSTMWIAPPHFFCGGRVIALYLGTNPEIRRQLEQLLGSQFAGRP